MRRTFRSLTAVLSAVALCAVPFTGPAAAAFPTFGAPPLPAQDPFYTAPSPLLGLPPGSILKSRPVTVTGLGLPVPVRAWQLMFLSRNAKNEPVEGIATVMVPMQSYPAGERPLLSYQTAEDSLARHCAPSYTLRAGTEKELPLATTGLSQGWAVVITDYEGPHSQYGAGWQAARATLDGIRAALRFDSAGLKPDTPVGMWGYSGGGLASSWAGELQPHYAPELNLAGVAQGGVPPDLEAVARQIDGGPFAGIYFAVAVGLSRAYPEMDVESILNDKGRAMVSDVGKRCAGDIISKYAFRSMSEFVTVDDPLTLPRMQRVIERNRLGQHRPDGPIFDYHAINDELILIAEVDELMADYCAAGVPLTYHRDALSEHSSLAVSGAGAAVGFLAARFVGQDVPETC